MTPADRSIRRVQELSRSMAPLVHIPLSRPATRCPAAHELLAQERLALAARPAPVAVAPSLGERVLVWLGVGIFCGLLAALVVERLAS